jgi:large subunit ribosomal protein L25
VASRSFRDQGRVPAVIYGRETKPQNLELNQKEFETMIHHSASENVLVDLNVAEDAKPKRLALIQDVQHHPLTGSVLHVDLHEVSETEMVSLMVPVEAIGEAAGVKTGGGVLEHVLFKIKVRALPKDLPEVIEVDVSGLEIGHSIHVGEIKAPAGVEILGDKGAPVLAVAAPVTEEQEAAAAAEGAAPGEVEMIKEKKEDGTTPAGDAAKGAAAKPDAKAAGAKPDAKAAEAKPEKKK